MEYREKIGIVCCSNGQKREYRENIKCMEDTLQRMGYQPVFSDYIYETESIFSGTKKERAKALMDFYMNDEIEDIFDISGGDVANGILPYLDYEVIANSKKRFWGYSDLTTVLNAIYAKTGKKSVLYQIKNLTYDHSRQQIADFQSTMRKQGNALFDINYSFIQQREMHGIIVGGNIRCFLKLAGTEYMPDLNGKILLLESFHGTVPQMETYLCQLEQLGAFDKAAGVLLGTCTQMEAEKCKPAIEEMLLGFVGKDLPVAVTKEIGHGTDAKAVMIGEKIHLEQK
ncbi:MAG: LD-carboxypeptidase [Lachnospiraceae bacterium]|nr:LD-carboxypeptidase [Lachnospiraceae bacterium]